MDRVDEIDRGLSLCIKNTLLLDSQTEDCACKHYRKADME
jgi:hypothetical protein